MNPQLRPRTLALDPGKHKVYGARASGDICYRLLTYTVDWNERGPLSMNEDRIFIEKPFHDPQRGTPGDPNDLIDLTASGFWIAGRIAAPLEWRLPAEWKRQRKKPIHHRAIFENILTTSERELFAEDTHEYIVAACKRYAKTGKVTGYKREATNHLDAIALLMTVLGRCRVGGGRL